MTSNTHFGTQRHASGARREAGGRVNTPRVRCVVARLVSLVAFGAAALSMIAAIPQRAEAQFSVQPHGQALGKATSIALDSIGFGLVNLVSGQIYYREIECSGEVINCGSNTPQGFTAPSAQMTIYVTFQTTNTGGPGRIRLKAYKAGMTPMDSGWYNVTVTPTDLVSDLTANNNANQDVGLCEASCFTPIYSQGTVPYYSLGAARNITLVYNGDRADPAPMLYTNASISTTKTVSEYWLEATRSTGARIKFTNGDSILRFAGTNAGQVRLGGQFLPASNTLPTTAMNALSVLLTAKFSDGTTQRQRFSSQVMSVDERKSPIARGWTIAGLQHLYKQADGNVLITDGSGSAAYFAVDQFCTTCFTNAGGDASRLTKGTTSWTRSYPDSTKAVFDTTGKLTSITDAFGNQTVFAYDGTGRLTEVQDPILRYSSGSGGRKAIVLTYGAYGLASVQNPSRDVDAKSGGRVTYFTVDPTDSTLRAIKDPDGDSTAFTYDADSKHRLRTVRDRRGGVTTYYLNPVTARLDSIVLPQVQLWNGLASPRLSYAGTRMTGVPTTSTGSTPWTPALSASLVDSVGDALGRKTGFTTNPWGQPLRLTDPIGQTTIISRSGIYPTSIQHPTNAIDSLSFVGPELRSHTFAGETKRNFRYAGWLQPDSAWGTGWPTVRMSVGANGRVDWMRVGPADSVRVTYYYDSRGRDSVAVDSLGHTTRYHYDPVFGNLDSTLAPGGRFTKATFDTYGRLYTQQSNDEPQRRVVYDSVDRVVDVYDGVNASSTHYTYDKLYLTQVQDPKGQVFRFDVNALGWVDREYDPDATKGYDLYTYDAAGNVHAWTNRRGQQVTYTYDALDRVTSKSGTNTTTDSVKYDPNRLYEVAWNGVSRDSIVLAANGEVDKVVTTIAGQQFQIGYRRNSIGQLDSVGVTGGGITFATRRYGWNRETGELDTVYVNGQATIIDHNKDLLPKRFAMPSDTEFMAWTAIHRPSVDSFSVSGINDALGRHYSYDSRFDLRDYSKWESGNFRTRQRGYEGLRRLSGVADNLYAPGSCPIDANSGYVCPAFTVQSSYTFDAAGNRTDAANAAYATGNRLRIFGNDTLAHDADGNVVLKYNTATLETKQFEWSADGLLTRVLVNGVERVRYDYNALGQLVRRWTNGVLDRHFLWDQDQLLAELDGNATQRIAEYAYLPGEDEPFALITGATTIAAVRYHVQDEVGNVIGLTNAATVDQQVSYDDWGVPTITGSTDNRLLFKGLLWEGNYTGMYYMRARWYDPELGRFVSEDPVGIDAGTNYYAFAENDPVNLSDPSGECPFCIAALVWAWRAYSTYQAAKDIAGVASAVRSHNGVGAALATVGLDLIPGGKGVRKGVGVVRKGVTLAEDAGAVTKFARRVAAERFFSRQGTEVGEHFLDRVAGRASRGITTRGALRAYNEGRLFFDPVSRNYIRHDSKSLISVVVSRPSKGRMITVFEGKASRRWVPVRWRR